MKKIKNIKLYGFTLIELLIVLAILGVLAVVVLIAINPTQQLAKGRDTGRKSSVTQLGRELASYFTARAIFPRNNNCTNMTSNWMDCLVAAGSLREIIVLTQDVKPLEAVDRRFVLVQQVRVQVYSGECKMTGVM